MSQGDTNWPGGRRDSKSSSSSGEDWILTYADAITLLMAFFVMMFSIAGNC